MSSGPRRDHTGPGSAPATASRDDPARTPDDAALREAVEAVSETGPDRGLLDDDIPSATDHPDRKSTRLNSSHVAISYAVFCLKKNPPWRRRARPGGRRGRRGGP